jgi:succinate dehydrogenase flavin-adding protein (antitoxin of CptAB toxin-antitoxin module)
VNEDQIRSEVREYYTRAAQRGSDGLGLFERMLALPDPDLQDMVLHPELMPAGEFAELVAAMRVFHGLESAGP